MLVIDAALLLRVCNGVASVQEGQRLFDEVNALLARCQSSESKLSAALGRADFNETRALEAEQRLADVRHAMEHAEEIGRMDHYAANTIKQAVKL